METIPSSEETFFRHPHFREGEGDKPLLFNVVKDVGSKSDVADEHQDLVERLTGFAEKAREDLGDDRRCGKNQHHRGKVDEPQPQLMSANECTDGHDYSRQPSFSISTGQLLSADSQPGHREERIRCGISLSVSISWRR